MRPEVNYYNKLPGEWHNFYNYLASYGIINNHVPVLKELEDRNWYLNENRRGPVFRGYTLFPPLSQTPNFQMEFKRDLGPVKDRLEVWASGLVGGIECRVSSLTTPKTIELTEGRLVVARYSPESGKTRWTGLDESGNLTYGVEY